MQRAHLVIGTAPCKEPKRRARYGRNNKPATAINVQSRRFIQGRASIAATCAVVPAIAEQDETYNIQTPYGRRQIQRKTGEILQPTPSHRPRWKSTVA
jgi:hypothetical protein